MKLRKGFLLTALTLTMVSILGTSSSVRAATAINSKTLNIKAVRSSGYGYKVANNSTKYIWKIYNTKNDINETFYCIKGGPGFGSDSMDSAIGAAEYTEVFDMRKPNMITPAYRTALSLLFDANNTANKSYERLMWVLDHCYIPAKTNASTEDRKIAEDSKKALLDAVEEYAAKYPQVYPNTSDYNDKLVDNLTNDDIDAIQQLAVWYYTNNDDYHVENNPMIQLGYQDNSYASLDSNDDEDNARIHAMNALFAYLTQTPKEAGFSYDYQTNEDTSSPVEIVKTNPQVVTSGNRSIAGPYTINEIRNIAYTLNASFTDANGNPITDVKFLDSNKAEMPAGTTIKNVVGSNKVFYVSVPATAKVKMSITGSYIDTTINYWSVANPDPRKDQPVVQVEQGTHPITDEITTQKFDLALRKFITNLAGKEITNRIPQIENAELQNLAQGKATGCDNTTAKKIHTKEALEVRTGHKVVYTIRVYNEGEIAGWATQVTDYLPEGLKFIPATESKINRDYGWTNPSGDGKTIVSNYLAGEEHKLEAFNKDTLKLDYEDLQIECEVIATVGTNTKYLKNVAEITGHKDKEGNTGNHLKDTDSTPGSLTKDQIDQYGEEPNDYQDDDDFELLKLVPRGNFDLSLRKFISHVESAITGKPLNLTSREPDVDVTPLLQGKDTANYNHTKEPVGVANKDIVTYTIRVYNEGKVNGYVTEIIDHLPPQLEFLIDDELNKQYGWQFVEGSKGRKVKTTITAPKTPKDEGYANQALIYADRTKEADKILLKAFSYKAGETLDYIDVQIRCKVKEDIDLYEKITNIAEITGFTDEQGNPVTDRDSDPANTVIPKDEELPEYKDKEIESGIPYIPGQEDEDDFEKLELKVFDLALRKFITGVENSKNTTEITNRVPTFIKNGNEYSYEHTKEPVEVAYGNIVIYTLRIFNEGNVAGYASKVKDDLPEGLEFLPEHPINTAFKWNMYREDDTETKVVSEAKYIQTEFLSIDNNKEENLIDAFHPDTMSMPDYKDVKIAFKVIEPNTSDRIIINQAQIAEDTDKDGKPVDDIDSTPNEWNEGEDDQDIEKIKVKYFDLSLKKWVTESIVTVDGKTTVTKSGHTGNEDPEPPMKVEIQNGKINKTTVKFRFNIKVTNEGEIAGYVKEIEDYIPEGLKFVAKDNPKWQEKAGKVTTDQLKDTLLQPGESATVDIVLTWINGKNNMGEKVNWAEISKDENEYNSPDIDSTPGNKVKGEDDIDQAPVILSPATGNNQTYIILILGCTTILAGGIFLIKKYVI